MKDTSSYNSIIKHFTDNLKKYEDDEKYFEEFRLEFVNKFSEDKLPNLEIDNYVIGKGNKGAFCHGLEYGNDPNKPFGGIASIGSIKGAFSKRYGVYYSQSSKEYNFAQKYGNTYKEAFSTIKQEIIKLIKNGKKEDLKAIDKSPLSYTFKMKILSVYYPDKYIAIFSIDHVRFFLDCLHISYQPKDDIDKLLEILKDFKNRIPCLKDRSNFMFDKFLYGNFGACNSVTNKFEQRMLEEDDKLINALSNIDLEKDDPQKKDSLQKKVSEKKQRSFSAFSRDIRVAKEALRRAHYKCECDQNHPTFKRKTSPDIEYTEPHHLIPMAAQDSFDKSIDIVENIVSLCSNCHNLVHYGLDEKVIPILEKLLNERKEALKKQGIEIELDQLLEFYNRYRSSK